MGQAPHRDALLREVELELELQLIVVCRLPPMDFMMALLAEGEQIGWQFIEHTDVCQMMDLGCWPLEAFLANTVGAPENMLAPFTPEGRAAVPIISCATIESGWFCRHLVLLENKTSGAR
jgi:hypothetical protein